MSGMKLKHVVAEKLVRLNERGVAALNGIRSLHQKECGQEVADSLAIACALDFYHEALYRDLMEAKYLKDEEGYSQALKTLADREGRRRERVKNGR